MSDMKTGMVLAVKNQIVAIEPELRARSLVCMAAQPGATRGSSMFVYQYCKCSDFKPFADRVMALRELSVHKKRAAMSVRNHAAR